MKYSKFYKTHGHSYEEYEKSHKERLDFLTKDLHLNSLEGKKIADVGCGLGFIYNRLNPKIQKNYKGYDGAAIKNPPFKYKKSREQYGLKSITCVINLKTLQMSCKFFELFFFKIF